MRHGDKINNLGRKTAHRHALMMNLACALIENKRIFTTLAKAKALRTFVEPIITKSKDDTTHSRRTVFSYLKNKDVVSTLFKDVAVKVAERNGGYTRISKLLYELAEEDNGTLVVNDKLTQQDIADRVGSSREMVSRIFKQLTIGGYVSTESKRIVLLKKLPARW